jgi:hypothetical protein
MVALFGSLENLSYQFPRQSNTIHCRFCQAFESGVITPTTQQGLGSGPVEDRTPTLQRRKPHPFWTFHTHGPDLSLFWAPSQR